MVSLNRLMFKKGRRRRRRIQSSNGLIAPVPQKGSLCQEDCHLRSGESLTYSGPNFPEDIWFHIHSLLPLRDSVHFACVSRTFMCFWKCHPKLIFTEEALGLKRNACEKGDIAKDFTSRVDSILKNHIGVGVKTLKIVVYNHYNVDANHFNSWLQSAITPGIEEITLFLPTNYRDGYNFPCSVLLNGRGNSIRYLHLTYCAFRPMVGFDCLRRLTKLHLYQVRITGNELGCLISKSFALEQLELMSCDELICLKIPLCLERLSCLRVTWCKMLKVIESTAPNLSSFDLFGDSIQLSLGESSQLKNLHVGFSYHDNFVSYSITRLPSIVPHLETLTISSTGETVDTPIAVDRFLHLKCLKIYLEVDYLAFSPAYDYLSLVSFLDASPALETFILSVNHVEEMEHVSVYGCVSPMRQIHGLKHHRLRKVHINGFCSAKSMVELTCHILENATSLESLTVDTIFNEVADSNISRCSVQSTGECSPVRRDKILEARKSLSVIRSYILGRVPSTVKLNVGEPCNRCHVIDV